MDKSKIIDAARDLDARICNIDSSKRALLVSGLVVGGYVTSFLPFLLIRLFILLVLGYCAHRLADMGA